MRTGTHGTALAVGALVLGLALSACARGSGAGAGGGPSVGPTDLRIVVTPGFLKGAAVHRYRLTCDPPTGTVPDPAAACAALARAPELLVHHRECATPDVGAAQVTGEFRGGRIDAGFGICGPDAAPWQRLASALGITLR